MNEELILIVDDEPRIRKLIKDFLKKENYEILEAQDRRRGIRNF